MNLDDAEIEESKRDLITREIGKFREVMKVIIFIIILEILLCHSYFSALLFGRIWYTKILEGIMNCGLIGLGKNFAKV